MYANRKLTKDEYDVLPCYAKACACDCGDNTFQSRLISCTPGFLRFPHDRPSQHLLKISVWNKTRDFVELVVDEPGTNLFHAYYDKMGIFGGAQTTIYVRCTPCGRKIGFDCLRIRVNGVGVSENISLPLQLFPGISWFVLPKLISLPHVSVGNVAEITLKLPKVPNAEKFFVAIRTPVMDAISITPFNGVLGGPDGIKELLIRYNPTEFITIVNTIELHFPGVDNTCPYDIFIYARCAPGLESEKIMQETVEIQSFMPKISKKKVMEPRMRIRPESAASQDDLEYDEAVYYDEDLTTPAGVVHFLLRKGGKLHDRVKTIHKEEFIKNQRSLRRVKSSKKAARKIATEKAATEEPQNIIPEATPLLSAEEELRRKTAGDVGDGGLEDFNNRRRSIRQSNAQRGETSEAINLPPLDSTEERRKTIGGTTTGSGGERRKTIKFEEEKRKSADGSFDGGLEDFSQRRSMRQSAQRVMDLLNNPSSTRRQTNTSETIKLPPLDSTEEKRKSIAGPAGLGGEKRKTIIFDEEKRKSVEMGAVGNFNERRSVKKSNAQKEMDEYVRNSLNANDDSTTPLQS